MIDIDKYDGASKVYITEHMWHGFTEVEEAKTGKVLARIYAGDTVKEAKPTPAHHILLDAFALHREVVRLREELRITQSNFSMVRNALANQYPEIEEAIWKVIE